MVTISIKYTEKELKDCLFNFIEHNGVPTNTRKDFRRINGLPSFGAYQHKLNIKTLIELLDYFKIEITEDERYNIETRGRAKDISKEDATKIIIHMRNKLGRELYYDDFRNPQKDEIGITTVIKIWGTMNNMKKELGLEIIQEDMVSRQITFYELLENIKSVANKIYTNEGRKVLLTSDFDKYAKVNSSTIWKMCKSNNTTLHKELSKIGFALQECGKGFNYRFADGEHVVSKYEYDFSAKLRELGLKFNDDYFRDVKYRTFIQDYKGLQNCDYVIKYNDKLLYIELAGFLGEYENWYKENRKINISAKEQYRIKLKEKENMFKSNNLDYRILFPSDLSEGFSIVKILEGKD